MMSALGKERGYPNMTIGREVALIWCLQGDRLEILNSRRNMCMGSNGKRVGHRHGRKNL